MAQEGTAAAEERTAPEPHDDGKPDSPTDIERPGWKFTMTGAATEFQRNQCTDLAAALTYFSVLSVFPGLLALVSLLGVFGQGQETTDAILEILRRLGQDQIADQLEAPIAAMVGSQSAGVTLVLGLVLALWSASGYVGAFGRSLNRIYQVDEGRPVWKLRPFVFLITLGLVVMAALVLIGLTVSGPIAQAIGDAIGLGDESSELWDRVKGPLILAIVIVMVAVLYYATPNVRHPRFRLISVGSTLAIGIWVLASLGFGFYVSNISRYNALYGSLGGVIVFLLWLWITNLALLFGAEVDAERERTRELRAGLPAERRLQLTPRDASASVKAAERLEERVAEGRRLRLAAVAAGAGAGGAVGDSTAGAVGDGTAGYGAGRAHTQDRHRAEGEPVVELEPLPSQTTHRRDR